MPHNPSSNMISDTALQKLWTIGMAGGIAGCRATGWRVGYKVQGEHMQRNH